MGKDKKFFHGHERLAEERAKLWETQQQAADFFGVSRVTWGQCERGNATPNGDVLAGLAQQGADVLYILTGQRSFALAPAPGTESRIVTKRQAALLDHHAGTDEQGKKIIEATAFAAAHPETRKKA